MKDNEIEKRKDNDLSESVIFKRGESAPQFARYFIGTSYLHMLTGFDSAVPIGNVTFEPRCRNNWHFHPGGQILLVTGGRGWYQEYGKQPQELKAGDVVSVAPDVKHWHGAAKDSWFVHLAVETDKTAGNTLWQEPVTDEEYDKLP